jgi:alginate O-acetyltransferase complex protein AlgI
MAPWILMWTTAGSLYAGCKWLSYRDARVRGVGGHGRSAAYLFLWPGMDADAFLSGAERVTRPEASEWLAAVLKTLFGAGLTWFGARTLLPDRTLLAGWVAMTGLIFVLHFGTFHLLSLVWRASGVNAAPLMKNPMRAESLADFWGRRWNTAFHVLADRFAFRPLRSRVGAAGATIGAFAASGLIHELVISVPAGGGYGLPTAYFLVQGLAVCAERSRAGRRLGLAHGWRGRLFAMASAAGPAFWLFPPVFVRNIVLPMLAAMGAI